MNILAPRCEIMEATACEGDKSNPRSINDEGLKSNKSYISNLLQFADLKAFERRLTEVITSYKPSIIRWRSM